MGRWSNASFTILLKLLKEELLCDDTNSPNSYYEAKKIFNNLGFLIIRSMLVLMIACYIGMRIAYSILVNLWCIKMEN
ncbi:hypothetical protein RDI58_001197 [Solanum bulbocastanum]|uniref:Uncharacterized protein n=1 Tax=Solanum bulbocastanum TaxID=147425 RepID=A0AAN8YMZ5_SOLBU